MKLLITHLILWSLALPIFFSCDEELSNVSGKNKFYLLNSLTEHQIDGQIIVRERNDGTTQLELTLYGTRPDGVYPAYIHFNTIVEGGGIAITLTPVDGNSGVSVTEITKLDTGSPISYQEILEFDGHLNVQLDDNQGTLVAQADVGENSLTGRFQQFQLTPVDAQGTTGLLTINERESGFSLVEVTLDNAIAGRQHPTFLIFGSSQQPGNLAATLNPVDGDNGRGTTHLEKLNGNLLAPYEALVDFQGFLRVHLGPDQDLETIMAEGNMGFTE